MHYFIGDLGHFFVITAFVTALVSAWAYWKAQRADALDQNWIINARMAFYAHSLSIIGVGVTLFFIIYNHYFEYNYAYSHSDSRLATHYLIATFWNGQEGSFWLWMFWQAVLGVILINTQKNWEAPLMVVFALVQGFLVSMILGIVIPQVNIKLGSSPFILLRDALQDPIFKMQPEFIPKDGSGLNPLLQNYWMVIHPPTLFLGFAATIIPFAFGIAGLWKKKYSEWVKPALPWTIFAGAILGLGILMGGYWAYETLNFGGYWNWDPVENAVYVPWLILIAAIHTMMTFKTNQAALRSSFILVIAVFVLILYSTFLTRSGILGEASVHSFTDLGLSGQLLIYLLYFTVIAIALLIIRWKEIPASKKELTAYSKEFWIFLGALTLCLMGAQVIAETSKPVYNSISRFLGGEGNRAPKDNAIQFYSYVQLWFAVVLCLLSGTAQFFWWRKMDVKKLKKELLAPVLFSLLIAVIVLNVLRVYNLSFAVLLFAGVYIIYANIHVLISLLKLNPKISGGAVAHIGVGLMLIGILFSAGYSKVVSLNNNGLLISKELGDEFNRDNLLLFVNEPRTMADYEIEFLGERIEPRRKSGYIKKSDVELTESPFKVVAKRDIVFQGKKLFNAKDTFDINPENTYYEIEMRKGDKVAVTLFPRVQINPSMGGGFVASPDIKKDMSRDIYTYVSLPMNPEEEPEWSKMEETKVKIGQQFFVNDYVAVLKEVNRIEEIQGIVLDKEDVAVKAIIEMQGERDTYMADPIFLIKGRSQVGRIPSEINDLGVKITLINIHPETNEFTLGLNTRQKDWVVIKAMEKPYINILWLGTGVLMIGFGMAMVRRFKES
jgi:cytochrome c-type biogenesis protein CcmF